MKILITGATGLVGTRLVEALLDKGYEQINILTRNKEKTKEKYLYPVEIFQWDLSKKTIDSKAFENVDIVFHLAGESVASGRWSKSRKQEILDSRVVSSKLILKYIKEYTNNNVKVISSSAIGIYGNRGNEELDENSSKNEDFLATVCKKWEEPFLNHKIDRLKTHIIRTGLVLSERDGALKKMLPPFQLGIGGKLGNGKHYMSWVHIDDLVEQYIFLMENNFEETIFNGVSPNPLTNSEFTKALGKALKKPTLFPVPRLALQLIFGEMSKILFDSQKVIPTKFLEKGFNFKFDKIENALTDLLSNDKITQYQLIEKDINEVFSFFSSEKNLEKITPEHLSFKVLNKSTENIQAGTIINYKLSLHGLPMKWQSKISNFQKNSFFTDEQLKGPYTSWVHNHYFHSTSKGTVIVDKINYQIPFGILGKIFAGYFVKKDLNKIFNYRRKSIERFLN